MESSAGIGLLVAAPSDRGGTTVMAVAGASFLAGAAAFGIAGPVLWTGSAPTQVTLLPQGRSARAIALPRISVSF